MPSNVVLNWVAGDTGLSQTLTLRGADGAAADLTGATVKWLMNDRGTGPVVVATLAGSELVSAANGRVARNRSADSDTATAGRFPAEIEVTYASGVVQTFPEREPFLIVVRDDLN